MLREHIDELHRISQILIERETIDKDQFARLVLQLPHLAGKLAGGLAAEIFAQILHALLRARAGSQRLRNRLVGQLLSGALGFRTSLVQVARGLGERAGTGRLIELLPQVIDVGEHLALFIGQVFKFALNLRLLLFRARLLEGRLQFAQAVIQVLLPLRQLFQAVGGLQLFLLRPGWGGRGLAFGFIAVLLKRQFKLVHLALAGLSRATPLAAAPRAGDLILMRDQFQEGLVSSLLRGHGGRKIRWILLRRLQRLFRALHVLDGRLQSGARGGVLGLFQHLLRLLQRLLLRLAYGGEVRSVIAHRGRALRGRFLRDSRQRAEQRGQPTVSISSFH